jgi:putative heme-binding domain-containing protein
VVVKSSDVAFRPIYAANAPDGSIFVSDMYEYYIAHGQHYQNQIDPSTGRLYRIRGRDLPLERDTNLLVKTPAQLVPLLAHPNKWHRLTAARLLGDQRARHVAPQIRQMVAQDSGLGALAAIWALHQMNAFDEPTMLTALRHGNASVRAWAVRFFGDRHGVNRGLGLPGIGAGAPPPAPPAVMEAIEAIAHDETNAEVRAQIASTARRLPTGQALRIAAALCAPLRNLPDRAPAQSDADASDPYIPLLTWWILEAHVRLDREAVLGWFGRAELWDRPLVQQHLLPRIMKRFAMEGRREDLIACARLLRLAPSATHAAALMKGFEEAYRGRETVGLPNELLEALADTGQTPLVLRVRQGDHAAIKQALDVLQDPKAPAVDRVFYARVFGEVALLQAVPVLRALAGSSNPVSLRNAALVSLMIYDQPETGPWATELLPRTNGPVRTAVLALLASRTEWSLVLLRAIESGALAASDVPEDIVARMRAHRDNRVAALLAKWFPAVPARRAGEWNYRIAEVEAVLKGGTGNPYAGEATYTARCASCHKLFFKGGKVGPDLTAYQRDNLGTMLLSIIDPNAEIREGFEYHLVETTDGRSLSGFLVERDAQIVVLRGLEGEDIALRQSDVKELRPVGRSLMPEGLLEGLDARQLRDFFAYLRISQPITR